MGQIVWAKQSPVLFRDYNTVGVPGSGLFDPVKPDVIIWGSQIEQYLDFAVNTGLAMLNGTLTAVGAANVLTIALKTKAGADPSASDPVIFLFPNDTGSWDAVKVTAALSIVVSAGSTLGTSAITAPRIWVTAWNNAGTVQLGVRKTTAGGIIYSLQDVAVSSTTAEGGTGTADSAGVHYTTSALTSKPYRIIGFVEWDTAFATPGNWTTPDHIRLFTPGMKKPGELVQRLATGTAAVATGTTQTPADDTIPQITEGTEFLSLAHTRASQCNPIRLHAEFNFASSVANTVVAALHRLGFTDAVIAVPIRVAAADGGQKGILDYTAGYAPGVTETWSLRLGASSAATVTLNGAASARLLAGTDWSQLEAWEYMG